MRSSSSASPRPPDADVAGGLEQPVVPKLDQPPTDPQVHLALGVIGQAGPRRLGDPVVAEPVAGVAADRVGDPPATAVDGLEQAKLEGRPKRLGDHVGRLRGRRRSVVEVELADRCRPANSTPGRSMGRSWSR